MSTATREVLLLSAWPEAHENLVRLLAANGIPVAVSRCPQRALRGLRRAPALVLVDLVHGAGLDRHAVARLNRSRGRTLVVALHEGGFGAFQAEVADLNVDGFCRAENWRPIAGLMGVAFHPTSQLAN